MTVTAYTDNVQVIASGSFLLRNNQSNAKLHLNMSPIYNFELDVIFTFLSERTGDDAIAVRKVHSNNQVELIISNAEEPVGNGTLGSSSLVGFSDGKNLTFNYIFSRPTPKNPRLLTYTFYIEG